MDEPRSLEEAIDRIDGMGRVPPPVSPESPADFGRFEGLPTQIELDLDGRTGRLLKPLRYESASGSGWDVPVGAWLDGASIPRAFWTIIGGPYDGKYREPSIVHDHFCIIRTRDWRDTHRMFHDAMRCRGVSVYQAKIMFYAVRRFGPRWEVGSVSAEAFAGGAAPTDADAASILADAMEIRDSALDLDAVEELADRHRDA